MACHPGGLLSHEDRAHSCDPVNREDHMATTFVEGRTRWKRFAVVLALSVLAAGVLLFAVAQGAIGASFAVSGSSFKISASQLQGSGFAQFASIDRTADGAHPVATTAIGSASMDDFCQSATARSIPGIGDVSLVIRAAGRDSVQASNMVIHIADLTGSRLSFHNADLGVDAGQPAKGPPGVAGSAGSFGQQADRFVLENLRATAWRTTASTLTLNGLDLAVTTGRSECF